MSEITELKCGKYIAKSVNLSESKFQDVNLSKVEFNNVNMSFARFHNINMSDVQFSAMQIGGAKFIHIGLPPDKNGIQEKQRGISFEEAHLNDSLFRKCKMTNVKIIDCEIEGMEIDGISVKEAIDFYKTSKKEII